MLKRFVNFLKSFLRLTEEQSEEQVKGDHHYEVTLPDPIIYRTDVKITQGVKGIKAKRNNK